MSRRREHLALAGLALVALAFALAVPTYPNYDSYFHLNWGRELLGGHLPHVQAYAAPTEHPLLVVVCAVLDLAFGGAADRALVVLCVLSLVVLVGAVLRVGRACFGTGPGLAAAVFTGSSFAFLLYAARGYVDVPFLAPVLVAAALEAEREPAAPLPGRSDPRPRGGRTSERPPGERQLAAASGAPGGRARGIDRRIAGVLAVAGLLRPEAWVLAGAYWLWRGPLRGAPRLELLVLAAVAPVLWVLCDLALTGDPLFSLHATSALADELGRERGIAHVPGSFVSFLADTARAPVFAAALLGAVLVVRARHRLHALHVPLALFAAGTVTFVGTGFAGLSILPRYLTVPAVALCLLAGYAVLGFTTLPAGPVRTRWRRGAIGAAVVGVAFLVLKAGSFARAALHRAHPPHGGGGRRGPARAAVQAGHPADVPPDPRPALGAGRAGSRRPRPLPDRRGRPRHGALRRRRSEGDQALRPRRRRLEPLRRPAAARRLRRPPRLPARRGPLLTSSVET